jgi:hypothetical protein
MLRQPEFSSRRQRMTRFPARPPGRGPRRPGYAQGMSRCRLMFRKLLRTKSSQQQKSLLPKLTTRRECRTELGMSRPIVGSYDPAALPEKS